MSKEDGATPYIVIGVVTILSLLVIIFGAIDIRNSIHELYARDMKKPLKSGI